MIETDVGIHRQWAAVLMLQAPSDARCCSS